MAKDLIARTLPFKELGYYAEVNQDTETKNIELSVNIGEKFEVVFVTDKPKYELINFFEPVLDGVNSAVLNYGFKRSAVWLRQESIRFLGQPLNYIK